MTTMSSSAVSHRLSHSIPFFRSLSKSPHLTIPTNSSSTRWAPHSARLGLYSTPAVNRTATKLAASASPSEVISAVESASEVVRKFYDGINGRDLLSVEGIISVNCVYEDLIFPTPFVGRKEILEFFENFVDVVDKDLQFVIDKISTEDSSSVGVTWHLEWKGKAFPFSKGCSFYQLKIIDSKRQIIYARDSVEPAIKPGKSALSIIRGVTWLLKQFPQLADRF